MKLKLYYSPGACSLSPHIVLREAGMDFDLEQVDLKTKKTKSGEDYLQINHKGSVPALVFDDNEVLTEGPAIVQYIADQALASKLLPANGTKERYHAQEWLNYISTELHKGFAPLWKPDTPDNYKSMVKENLARQFTYLDKHFAKNQYVMGNAFSAPDAYCFTVLNWAKPLQVDLSKWTNLTAYHARVGSRPKVQEAMQAEGLLKKAA